MRLRLHWWLGIAAVWCWLYVRQAAPLTPPVLLGLTPLFIGGAWLLYRDVELGVTLGRRDLVVVSGLLALQLIGRVHSLFNSLGGDELFHAAAANPLLFKLSAAVANRPERSLEFMRASMWRLFDPRHWAVIDLWRAISFALLLAGALIGAGLARLRVRHRLAAQVLGAAVLIALSLAGVALAQEALSPHPPLRLLPLLAFQVLFGFESAAMRLSGVVTVVAVGWVLFRMLQQRDREAWAWHFAAAAAIGFIPVVFHVAGVLEPSVYAFAVASVVLLLGWRFLEERDPRLLILAGVLTGLGVVLRTPALYVWVLVGALALSARERTQPLFLARVSFPALLSIPHLLTVHVGGHTATSIDEGSAVTKILLSLTNGVGPMSILNTGTLPWLLATAALLALSWQRLRWRERALYLIFLPAYALYHSIWSYLWPIGRYQSEYVAPLQLLTIFFAARLFGATARRVAVPLLLALVAYTWQVDADLALDTNYADWPKMRITTEASFPYREALGFLKAREAQGRFVILGGSPRYNELTLWLSGHSFTEARAQAAQQVAVESWAQAPGTKELPRLLEVARASGTRYLVVQSGTRRELQHRSQGLQAVIDLVESAGRTSGSGIARLRSFGPEVGGVLDVYELN
ncbi:MAG: glycosyltransferase family 39 protein [Deltaproteobacteria bacterium]|nr:glycosyltransferase family 39 protein [Deltaproteobacteria bacterium]